MRTAPSRSAASPLDAGARPYAPPAYAPPRNDRFLRACRREPVDTTPVWFMRQAGRALPEYRAVRERASLVEITRDAALCAEVTLQPVRRLGVDAAILFADITTPLPALGVDVEIREGFGPIIERPIRSGRDVTALRVLDPVESVPALLDAIGLARRAFDVPLIGFAGAPFTLACYLVEGGPSRDFRATKALMRADPDAWSGLMDVLADATVRYLEAQVRAGADAVQLFDSWVGVLSPFDYEHGVLPWMERLFGQLGTLGVPTIHFGVDTTGLLPLMARAGGDVIGLDWRVGLADGWSRVGDRAIQGNLDPSVLLGPFGGAAAAAASVLAQADGRPGHVFNLGHGVLPDTDPDDLARLVDFVHEHGRARSTGHPRATAEPDMSTGGAR